MWYDFDQLTKSCYNFSVWVLFLSTPVFKKIINNYFYSIVIQFIQKNFIYWTFQSLPCFEFVNDDRYWHKRFVKSYSKQAVTFRYGRIKVHFQR